MIIVGFICRNFRVLPLPPVLDSLCDLRIIITTKVLGFVTSCPHVLFSQMFNFVLELDGKGIRFILHIRVLNQVSRMHLLSTDLVINVDTRLQFQLIAVRNPFVTVQMMNYFVVKMPLQ